LDITIGDNNEYCTDITAEQRQVLPQEVARIESLAVGKSDSKLLFRFCTYQFYSSLFTIKIFPRQQDGTSAMLAT